ncbi:MAG TPA: twin-arginine translocation signal domain-containing protein [Xanthobacteraceae bacterium]|nr:twin-arginine translocation signal domain-containing protein [Xanthobacteraceae bacterium]
MKTGQIVPKAKLGRREFLRAVGAGATVAAASVGPLTGEAIADTESSREKRKSRYRETEHVKTFYRVNRY